MLGGGGGHRVSDNHVQKKGCLPHQTCFTFLHALCLHSLFQQYRRLNLRLCGNARLRDAKSPENETSRPITYASEFSRSGQNFLRPTFLRNHSILLVLKILRKKMPVLQATYENTPYYK